MKDINKFSKQELIKLLHENGIVPDSRCTTEDLISLIEDEDIKIK